MGAPRSGGARALPTPLITGVSGTCSESEFSCSIGSIISSCTIRAKNATRTSYLINQCSLELVQIGVTNARFSVYLQENGGTITLDIATNGSPELVRI